MREGLKFFGFLAIFAAVFVGILFGVSALGLIYFQFFAPKFQAAQRDVYEQTPSYVQGKEQSLAELQFEYQRAKTQGEKNNIRSMIVNEAATIDLDLIKDRNLRRFVFDMREGN